MTQPGQDKSSKPDAGDSGSGDGVPARPKLTKQTAPPNLIRDRGPKPTRDSFRRSERPVNPRRVRGGVKLRTPEGEAPAGWISQRIFRYVEGEAGAEARREGLDYARQGQTRRLTIEGGEATASVQGRGSKPYRTIVRLTQIPQEKQEKLIAAMSDQAAYAAKLLTGEMPTNIDDLLGPLEIPLFPTDSDDVTIECSCQEADKPWCKHAVCAVLLLAERLSQDPVQLFSLRGLPGEELVESLRERRLLASRGEGPADLVRSSPPAADNPPPPLDECADAFWEAGPGLDRVDLPVDKPPVGHVLLRRLGSSPFPEGRFPLLGLLATCYELIGEAAIQGEPDAPDVDEAGEDSGGEEA